MNNFKVGDKVRVKSERGSHWNSYGEMDSWMGEVCTISHIETSETPGQETITLAECTRWAWHAEDFEHIDPPKSIPFGLPEEAKDRLVEKLAESLKIEAKKHTGEDLDKGVVTLELDGKRIPTRPFSRVVSAREAMTLYLADTEVRGWRIQNLTGAATPLREVSLEQIEKDSRDWKASTYIIFEGAIG